MDQSKIKANINSLILANNKILAQIKSKESEIETKDTDMEAFMRDVENSTNGAVLKIASVSGEYASKVYEGIRVLSKKIDDNIVAINELIGKLDPVSISGVELHNFTATMLMYKIFIESGILHSSFDNNQIVSGTNSIKTMGMSFVSIPVKVDVASITSSSPTISEATKTSVINAIQQIHSMNLIPILDVYISVAGDATKSTTLNPSDIAGWFTNWQTVLNTIVDLAKDNSVQMVSIGSRMDLIESAANSARWISLIQTLKARYQGIITYKTSWWNDATTYDNKLNNSLFGELDIISIAAYFRLTSVSSPTLAQIKSGWSNNPAGLNIVQQLQGMSTKWSKSIMFGEIGYTPDVLTANQPWINSVTTLSIPTQQNAYQALYDTFKDLTWFAGFCIYQVSKSYGSGDYYNPSGKADTTIATFDFER